MPNLNQPRDVRRMSESAKRWVKRVVAFIVTLGAVAGALSAVKALWPSADPPDPEDSARLAINVISDVSLHEYSLSQHLAGARLLQPTEEPPIPTDEEPPPDTDQPCAPGNSCIPTENPSEDGGSTVTDVPSGSPGSHGLPNQPSVHGDSAKQKSAADEGFPPYANAVEARACGLLSGCKDGDVLHTIAAGHATDEKGNKVDPEVAARRVLQILDESRTANNEPVGAIITVDVELIGLRGRPVHLTWAMWHASGGGRLHESWLNNHLAYRMLPDTDHDSATVDLWVPLPRTPGPFVVDVAAKVAGTGIAKSRSNPFT